MPFIEAPSTFYLGRQYDPERNRIDDDVFYYDSRDLTTHALILGMTGSGKTGLSITMLEEASLDHIPAIIIDPKGDMTNLLLRFPNLTPEDFLPWVNEDDARRVGLNTQEYARDISHQWQDGLASWSITRERLAEFKRRTNVSIFTPGSDAGLSISILATLQPPSDGWAGHEEMHRERISGIASAILALTGISAKLTERGHVLIANIIEYAWREGIQLTFSEIIVQIQQPPFSKLGVLDVNTYFPAKDRAKLALELNNVIAAPGFQSWLEGEPLEIHNLLYTPDGAPRISIFYLAHLNDSQRQFVITLILESMLTWMRTLSGTTKLRALLCLDEIYGLFPPYPHNPPTKDPLLRLLKQGRAFGIGLILATQAAGDIDYKGLANVGTWFIGRPQTEKDKKKILDGLAVSYTKDEVNFSEINQQLSNILPRVFLVKNVHDTGGTRLIHTRWAMSYLPGPMTRGQIAAASELMFNPLNDIDVILGRIRNLYEAKAWENIITVVDSLRKKGVSHLELNLRYDNALMRLELEKNKRYEQIINQLHDLYTQADWKHLLKESEHLIASGIVHGEIAMLRQAALLALDREKTDFTHNPIWGVPQQKSQYRADIFMLMPFREELTPVYEDHIKGVASELKLSIKRGDDFFSEHAIVNEIWAAINTAKLIIADCTGRNPNVFYELGLSHVVGKPAIMITQNPEDIPFDLRHLRFIHYQYTPRGIQKFERELKTAILRILNLVE